MEPDDDDEDDEDEALDEAGYELDPLQSTGLYISRKIPARTGLRGYGASSACMYRTCTINRRSRLVAAPLRLYAKKHFLFAFYATI